MNNIVVPTNINLIVIIKLVVLTLIGMQIKLVQR